MREITDFPPSVEIYDFFKKCANLRPHFWPSYNLKAHPRPPSDSPQQKTIPGNKLRSKFERMELDQKLTFSTKKYQYVASPPEAHIPDTVLLFEPRMRHPALRVTSWSACSGAARTSLLQLSPTSGRLLSDGIQLFVCDLKATPFATFYHFLKDRGKVLSSPHVLSVYL